MIDENVFFREAVKRICGSLDIQISFAKTFEYIRSIIPIDTMGLHVYEGGYHSIRSIIQVDDTGSHILQKITPLPEELAYKADIITIINHPEEDSFMRTMIPNVDLSEYSVLIMKIYMADLFKEYDLAGALSIRVKGRGRYTEEHAHLLSLLYEPFAIVLASAEKHQALIELTDKLADDNQYLRKELQSLYTEKIIGEATGLKNIMTMVRQVAPLSSPVLILGETGVGKDVIASAIHRASPRRNGPFIKVNCGAIPETLLDSELFGHEKGAFTGAITQKKGRFERAHQGTIFLDEIGELLPQAQVRMLRVLQEKEIERIGGSKTVPVDIRLIAATNRNLEDMVQAKTFREDLWFRLNVFPIVIPPLRNRKEDIPALVRYFFFKKTKELKIPIVPPMEPSAIDCLLDYHWPGNVRELENVVERALILNQGGPFGFGNLIPNTGKRENGLADKKIGDSMNLAQVTAEHIQNVLHITGGKIHGPGGAAEILGINASTLRNRMEQMGIPFGRKHRQKN